MADRAVAPVRPTRPDPERVRQANAIFDAHRRWVEDNTDAPFEPNDYPAERSEYNIHYPDLEADPESLDDFHDEVESILAEAEETRALIWALDDISRRAWTAAEAARHPRNPRGTPGGGRFRSVAARIADALQAWLDGDEDDPLDGFTREQLRLTARARGLPLRRGASTEEIKLALLNDVREGRARTRQVQLDRVRGVAHTLAEIDELVHNQASDRALRHRVDSTTRRGGVPDPIREQLLAAVDAGDRAELEALVDRVAADEGLTPIESAGAAARMDRRRHEVIGSPVEDDAPVVVNRRGYVWRDPAGGEVLVDRAQVMASTEEEYARLTQTPGLPRRGRASRGSADGLDAMNDRDLHDLAMEYSIPPVGLGTADRTALIRRLRDAGATAPRSQVQASRRPSVGLRMSLLLNTWANGDGPDDPLDESGFTRDQLRAAARSRNITVPRGASEHAIRQAIYDSVRTPARQRRANAGSLAPMGDLFGRMSEATRQARVREVFEGDFGGLTTHVDDVHAYRDRAFGGGTEGVMSVRGHVRDSSGQQVGTFSRQYHQRVDGTMTAYHAYLQIAGSVQGNGFSNAFNGHLISWYRRSGVQTVSVHANIDVGGYTWANFGYDFDSASEAQQMVDRFQDALRGLERGTYGGRRLRGQGMQEDQQITAVRALLARTRSSRFGQPGYPTAYEFSQAGRWEGASGRSDVWIGKALMLGTSWYGVLDLTTPSPTGS